LFADVVHSMDIAAAVGAERLREIMSELLDRSTGVVKRYGGTLSQFTGDGIMAVFGAPITLEDHAFRACLAALGIQEEAKRLAAGVQDRDGIDLFVRVGLNSGQVIAGEIGSGPFGYTAIGEQVGMAQRMESVAPPGGVMLSASTARLVDGAAALAEPETVQIKGVVDPVYAHRLLGMGEQHRAVGRTESNLVGRRWEMSAVEGLLDRAIDGHGAVVGVAGPPGIGKSRLTREVAAIAASRSVQVFTTFCESHTSQVPFHVVTRLFRAATGVEGLDAATARALIRTQPRDVGSEDLALFEDLLGIGDSEAPLPQIDPDARRRRLTALVNAASLANQTPAVYVIEDAHWIDESSESMLADFLKVIPQTPFLTLITYRPEYRGALAQVPGAQTLALAPLSDPETAALVSEQLGPDPSVHQLGQTIAEKAAGTPFFAEEIVRELSERGVLQGTPGAYVSKAVAAEVTVPATLQATIAARIDRLDPQAKRTLSAAAVVGSRFGANLLTELGIEPVVEDLLSAQLIDQVTFTGNPEYVFHHPLIRAVAYESQLKSDRAERHRRAATAIEVGDPASADENAALIAEHLEAAGDLQAAFDWHMRAGAWSLFRDIAAALTSWQRAKQVADRLPDDDPDRLSMRIAPRAALCGNAFRVGANVAAPGFDELRELCLAATDQRSLAIGMAAVVTGHLFDGHRSEASSLADELVGLLESIDDPTLTIGLSIACIAAKHETGEMADVLRWAQRMIDLAEGDRTTGNLLFGSPLAVATAWRGIARCCLGMKGWKGDLHEAIVMAHDSDPMARASVPWYAYVLPVAYGVLLPDATALRETSEALELAEQSGEDITLFGAGINRCIVLVHRGGPERAEGVELLMQVRARGLNKGFSGQGLPVADMYIASEKASSGDFDGAIEQIRQVVDDLFASGGSIWSGLATTVLVDALMARGAHGDLAEAGAAIDRLAGVPTDPRFVLYEITLLRLRALLARARGDEAAYRECRDRYVVMANSLGFEGHMKWAEAMP
jgi:adenylate cyclase